MIGTLIVALFASLATAAMLDRAIAAAAALGIVGGAVAMLGLWQAMSAAAAVVSAANRSWRVEP